MAAGVVVRLAASCLSSAALVSILVEGLQAGFTFEAAPLKPKASRLNPAQGAARICSSLASSLINLVFVLAFLGIAAACIRLAFTSLPAVFFASNPAKFAWAEQIVRTGLFGTACLLLVFGGVDYLLQRRSFRKSVMMSYEELIEERRESDGDPHIRAMRRMEHESLLYQDISARVRRAKVIVVEESDGE